MNVGVGMVIGGVLVALGICGPGAVIGLGIVVSACWVCWYFMRVMRLTK